MVTAYAYCGFPEIITKGCDAKGRLDIYNTFNDPSNSTFWDK